MTTQVGLFSAAKRCDVTPKADCYLAGRGDGARRARGIAAELEANCVLLPVGNRFIALVALDTLFASDDLKRRIVEHLRPAVRRKLEDIIIVASHTHNASSLDPTKPNLGAVDPEYLKEVSVAVSQIIASAIDDVSEDMQIRRGLAECFANARRRVATWRLRKAWPFLSHGVYTAPNQAADVPRKLDLIYTLGSDGRPKWCVWSWVCHCTAFYDPHLVHPDFPGVVRAHIRAEFGLPDLPVVFLPGFAGDIRADAARGPVTLAGRCMTPLVRPFASPTPENFNALCRRVCGAAQSAIDSALPQPSLRSDTSFYSKKIPLVQLMTSEPSDLGLEIVWLCQPMFDLVFMGAETCSPWLAKLAPLFSEGTMFTGYANAVPCYLPTAEQMGEGGYEVDGFRASFGIEGKFRSDMPRIVTDNMMALARGTFDAR
jgi:hypothetical protein